MSASALISADKIQMDYMKLLVTQLQNQNPLEPMDNGQMAAQLAQFSQLQQLESMNSNFAKVMSATELNYATSLLGKEISFIGENETGTDEVISGVVEQISNGVEGEILLSVGNYTLDLADVISVKN